MTVGSVDPALLSPLPALFRTLMAAPVAPLNRGYLPIKDAVYLLYRNGMPVQVGSPPYLDESILASSVRVGVTVVLGRKPPPADRSLPPQMERMDNIVMARWVPVELPLQRLLLETYTAQRLGVSVSHPRLIEAMTRPPSPQPKLETV